MLESENLLEAPQKKETALGDFAQAFGHTLVETPINGVSQLINKTVGSRLPQLDLIGQPKEQGLATAAGTITAGALDYYLLSKVANNAMGNLGGTGMSGSMLRAGIVGGVYTGVFLPSDPGSPSFFRDRLSNAAVGAATFATMAAGAEALNKSGFFAVPEVRSLGGSITVGALSGLSGGVAHAEANALFKNGSLLPRGADLLKDSTSYAAFGAAFGALDFGYNQTIGAPKVTEVSSMAKTSAGDDTNATVRVFQNQKGDVVKIQSEVPAQNSSITRIGLSSTKMGDGSWSTQAREILGGNSYSNYDGSIIVPTVKNVEIGPSGAVKISTTDGDIRTFNPNGQYQRSNPEAEAQQVARDLQLQKADQELRDRLRDYVDGNGIRNITMEYPSADGKPIQGITKAALKGNEVESISFNPHNSASSDYVAMKRLGSNSWSVQTEAADGTPLEYRYDGDIKPLISSSGKVEGFQVSRANGQSGDSSSGNSTLATIDKTPESVTSTLKAVMDNSKLQGFNPNWRYIRMDGDGNLFIKPGDGTINGNKGTMTEVPIKPGDNVSVTFDIGDRVQHLKDFPITWTKTLDDTLLFNGIPLKPNTAVGLDVISRDAPATY